RTVIAERVVTAASRAAGQACGPPGQTDRAVVSKRDPVRAYRKRDRIFLLADRTLRNGPDDYGTGRTPRSRRLLPNQPFRTHQPGIRARTRTLVLRDVEGEAHE